MASQFCVRVGNNIKKYRKEAGITLKELGEKIGVTEATAQKYEAGNIKKIDVEMLKKISDALGTTPEKLTGWESKAQYEEYRAKKQGEEEASVIKYRRTCFPFSFLSNIAISFAVSSLIIWSFLGSPPDTVGISTVV